MPYDHTAETVVPAVQADKTRIERIHIRTPSDDDGNAVTGEYSVVIEIAKFDAVTGKKQVRVLVKTDGIAEVQALMALLPLNGTEALGDQIKRHGYDLVVQKGQAPAGGTVS